MTESQLNSLRSILAELAPQGRPGLLPALHAAQRLCGWLPEEVAVEVAQALRVPLADVYGVIDFYAMLYREPVGRTVIRVCNDPACALAGSEDVLTRLSRQLGTQSDSGTAPSITIESSPCLGLCAHAPAVQVNGRPIPHADSHPWESIVEAEISPLVDEIGGSLSLLTANCREGRPLPIPEYHLHGGYESLRKVLQMPPQAVIDEIKASGLVGRGGAAFPTGIKWEGTARAEGSPKYVVCNGDEAEPGTFKDRILLENDPHSVLEGLIIAAYAVGAEKGFIYIRGEYQQAYQIMKTAVEEARQARLLGSQILGSSFSFDVELRQGAGAYICGEETALFESIEGKHGFPRIKPPFPTTYGVFGKPTSINNVETLANVPLIVRLGAEGYRKIGTEKSPGPKLFCLSGDVRSEERRVGKECR